MSPILFSIYGEYIMRNSLTEWEEGIVTDGERVNNLRYPDDRIIIAGTEEEMATILSRIETESK